MAVRAAELLDTRCVLVVDSATMFSNGPMPGRPSPNIYRQFGGQVLPQPLAGLLQRANTDSGVVRFGLADHAPRYQDLDLYLQRYL